MGTEARAPIVLVVDDDAASRRLLRAILAPEGFDVVDAESGAAADAALRDASPDLVLLDLRLPDADGLDVLRRMRRRDSDVPVVIVTATVDVQTAVRATQCGAFQYLTKPVDADEVLVVARNAIATRARDIELATLRRRVRADDGDWIRSRMGSSPAVARVAEQIATVADSTLTVLIKGETGTGKEIVAQAIHRQSGRRDKPLVAVDCGALPEALVESELFGHEKGAFSGADASAKGRLRLADGGTMLLDEVGNLPLALQPKLLRVLESREVTPLGAAAASAFDVRFIAATNVALSERVGRGEFREDLYFRLAQFKIVLPPLRERASDVAELVRRFLAEASLEARRPVGGVSSEALSLLEGHPWPGNVRELRNVVRRAVLESKSLEVDAELVRSLLSRAPPVSTATIPADLAPAPGLSLREVANNAARAAERTAILAALAASGGNKSRAARALQTDYKTLLGKLKRLGLAADGAADA